MSEGRGQGNSIKKTTQFLLLPWLLQRQKVFVRRKGRSLYDQVQDLVAAAAPLRGPERRPRLQATHHKRPLGLRF